jgi:hypothetical protein
MNRPLCRFLLLVAIAAAGFFSGCTTDKSAGTVCDLTPCSTVGCNNCGWPAGSCYVASGTLSETPLPDDGLFPYYVLMDIEVMSSVQAQDEEVCRDGRLSIQGVAGEIIRTDLSVDVPLTGFCYPVYEAGPITVELQCPSFPTRARYRISIADAAGSGVRP